MIEQNQKEWQNAIQDMRENNQEVSVKVSTIGENLLKLQERLKDNVQELVGTIEATCEEQAKFQEKIQSDVRALADSVEGMKQKQIRLQDQIQEVKNNAETMNNDLQTALEELEGELYPIVITEQPEITEGESPESSSLISEPNSME